MNVKKVLYFYQAGHYPNPRKSGADRVFFVNVNALSNAGYEVIYIEIGEAHSIRSGKANEYILLESTKEVRNPTWYEYRYKRWIYPILHPGRNNYSLFLNEHCGQLVQALIEKYDPELLFYENIRTFMLSSKIKTQVKSIVCIHDLDYILNFGKNINRLRNSNSRKYIKILKSIQLRIQYYAEKIFILRNLSIPDGLYVVSRNDLKTLNGVNSNLFHADCPVTVFPNTSQLKIIETKLKIRDHEKVKILHVGKINASHNRKGVSWFLSECWPKLKLRNSSIDYEIHFIGSTEGYDEELVEFKKEPKLKFRGFVEDLEQELIEADFMIVPPGYPTGVRTKIPEAFAWGLPVVTGYYDAFGAGIIEGQPGVLITDSADEYVANCLELINDASVRNKMGKEALASWPSKYGQVGITEHITSNILAI